MAIPRRPRRGFGFGLAVACIIAFLVKPIVAVAAAFEAAPGVTPAGLKLLLVK